MKLSSAFQHALREPLSDSVLRRSLPRGHERWSSLRVALHWRERYWAARLSGLPAATKWALENYRAWRRAALNGE